MILTENMYHYVEVVHGLHIADAKKERPHDFWIQFLVQSRNSSLGKYN